MIILSTGFQIDTSRVGWQDRLIVALINEFFVKSNASINRRLFSIWWESVRLSVVYDDLPFSILVTESFAQIRHEALRRNYAK